MSKGGIIVLEGADSSGKTTLAKAIGGDNYFHGLPFEGWVYEAHTGMLSAALRLAKEGKLVVVDRHWVSEFVYGPVFRGGPAYDTYKARMFDQAIRTFGLYVLCVPADLERQELRWQETRAKGKFEHFDQIRDVVVRYADLANGNLAHPGDNYLDEYIRHGDFVSRGRCLIYDVDVDGKDVPKFVDKIRRAQ